MKEDMVRTLIRATGNSYAHRQRSGTISRLFITLLFAALALFLLIALLLGTNGYRSVNNVRTNADETRLGLSLIANSIRTNDTTDAVGASTGPEGRALVLTEVLETGSYETRIYSYQGAIVEEYSRSDSAYTPEKARAIVSSSQFDFSYENGLLTVYTDQGQTSVALRSVRGGS